MGYVGTERGEEDLVRLYLHDIGQYPLLTKDDEARLAQAIEARSQAGQDLQAKDARLTAPRRRELETELPPTRRTLVKLQVIAVRGALRTRSEDRSRASCEAESCC